MIEGLRDSQDRRKSPCDALVRIAQRRIGGMMPRWFRLSIVIAHQCRRDSAVAPFETRDIAVQRQVLPMLMMSAMTDHVSGIVQERPRLQQHSRMRQHMM